MRLKPALVVDTSVWINLLATARLGEIIDALGCTCYAPEEVVREIQRDPITQKQYLPEEHPLRKIPNVEIVELTSNELEIFLSLVGRSSSESLGDGEAAVIAVAHSRNCPAALDDRKARAILEARYPGTPAYMSVDLLRSAPVLMRLGTEGTEVAFNHALQIGRMHIPKGP